MGNIDYKQVNPGSQTCSAFCFPSPPRLPAKNPAPSKKNMTPPFRCKTLDEWKNVSMFHQPVRTGWWLKSCTTWDIWNLVNNGINYQPQLVGRISSINSIISLLRTESHRECCENPVKMLGLLPGDFNKKVHLGTPTNNHPEPSLSTKWFWVEQRSTLQ